MDGWMDGWLDKTIAR